MGAPRLTKDQKSTIVNKVLNKTFTNRQEALTVGFKTLGDDIWESLYGGHRKVLAATPPSFLSIATTISVHFDSGMWSYDHIPMSGGQAVPSQMARCGVAAASYEPTDPFAVRHRQLSETKEKLAADRELLKRNLDSLFYSVNTRKQALAAWPECEPYLPADVPVIKNLPALPTHDLNALIAQMQGGE